MKRPLRALVFDFDGTLVETIGDLHAGLNRTLADAGRGEVNLGDARRMVGDGSRNLVARAFAATGPALEEAELDRHLERFLEYYSSDISRLSHPYPGVVETLAELQERGLALGICTNKPERMARLLLEALDLDGVFGAIIGGDTLPQKKPDPTPLLTVLEMLGAAPEEALMVGDATQDQEAARRAGTAVVLVSFGYSRVPVAELDAEAVIDEFPELLEICADLFEMPGRPVTAGTG